MQWEKVKNLQDENFYEWNGGESCWWKNQSYSSLLEIADNEGPIKGLNAFGIKISSWRYLMQRLFSETNSWHPILVS